MMIPMECDTCRFFDAQRGICDNGESDSAGDITDRGWLCKRWEWKEDEDE